jgi:hypothetical protein
MTYKNPTVRQALKLATTALLPVVLLAACSNSGPTPRRHTRRAWSACRNSGFGGEFMTGTRSTTATVISADPTKRLVVLKCADGSSVTYKAARGAFGFDDNKAGDDVKYP